VASKEGFAGAEATSWAFTSAQEPIINIVRNNFFIFYKKPLKVGQTC
jgi:hypothetical protein